MRVRRACTATGIPLKDGRITTVETDAGDIATDTVVCAAGAWSREVGALAGVDIPVEGEARWMFFSPDNGGLGDDLPLTIDFTTGFYTHREGPGIVFGGREPELEDLAVHALHRLPLIAELPIQSQWWGCSRTRPTTTPSSARPGCRGSTSARGSPATASSSRRPWASIWRS